MKKAFFHIPLLVLLFAAGATLSAFAQVPPAAGTPAPAAAAPMAETLPAPAAAAETPPVPAAPAFTLIIDASGRMTQRKEPFLSPLEASLKAAQEAVAKGTSLAAYAYSGAGLHPLDLRGKDLAALVAEAQRSDPPSYPLNAYIQSVTLHGAPQDFILFTDGSMLDKNVFMEQAYDLLSHQPKVSLNFIVLRYTTPPPTVWQRMKKFFSPPPPGPLGTPGLVEEGARLFSKTFPGRATLYVAEDGNAKPSLQKILDLYAAVAKMRQ